MQGKRITVWLKWAAPLFIMLCMMICTVRPVQAASKITLKSGAAAPSTIYVGHSYTLKVAGTAVKFFSSNKSVASIGQTTGKLKPVSPGTVKITAKNKKTGKAVATKTFRVHLRAKSVSVDADSEIIMKKDDTLTLHASLVPENSTDVVRFFSSDKNVVTVGISSGKLTAKQAGKATITVYAKATKETSNNSKYNKCELCKKVTLNPITD